MTVDDYHRELTRRLCEVLGERLIGVYAAGSFGLDDSTRPQRPRRVRRLPRPLLRARRVLTQMDTTRSNSSIIRASSGGVVQDAPSQERSSSVAPRAAAHARQT